MAEQRLILTTGKEITMETNKTSWTPFKTTMNGVNAIHYPMPMSWATATPTREKIYDNLRIVGDKYNVKEYDSHPIIIRNPLLDDTDYNKYFIGRITIVREIRLDDGSNTSTERAMLDVGDDIWPIDSDEVKNLEWARMPE